MSLPTTGHVTARIGTSEVQFDGDTWTGDPFFSKWLNRVTPQFKGNHLEAPFVARKALNFLVQPGQYEILAESISDDWPALPAEHED